MISVSPAADGDGVTIRPWASRDAPAVDALLAGIWGHDPQSFRAFSEHGSARDEPDAFRRTLTAKSDGRLVGVATVWENPLHPIRWRLVAHVDPGFRRRGIGSALVERLQAEVAPRGPRPWQSATRADDDVGRAFLARHGFRPLMRTRLGTLDPARLGKAAWGTLDAATAAATEAGCRIVALADLPADPPLRPSLASLHAEIYRQAHGWNPPATLSEDDARRLFLGDDLIPASLFVALADDRPVGVASLRLGSTPAATRSWVGSASPRGTRIAPRPSPPPCWGDAWSRPMPNVARSASRWTRPIGTSGAWSTGCPSGGNPTGSRSPVPTPSTRPREHEPMDTAKIPQRSSSATWEYDTEADVLYLSLGEPRPAVGVDVGDGLVLRYDEARQELTGLTVIGLRKRLIRGLKDPS